MPLISRNACRRLEGGRPHLPGRSLEVTEYALRCHVNANPISTWKSEARGSVIDGNCSCNGVAELGFVGGSHDHHVGQAPHVRHVRKPAMCGPVRADQSRPVHGKAHCTHPPSSQTSFSPSYPPPKKGRTIIIIMMITIITTIYY